MESVKERKKEREVKDRRNKETESRFIKKTSK